MTYRDAQQLFFGGGRQTTFMPILD